MMTNEILNAQTAIELPAREMLSYWNYSINITVPVNVQNNINVQFCGGNCVNYQHNLAWFTF